MSHQVQVMLILLVGAELRTLTLWPTFPLARDVPEAEPDTDFGANSSSGRTFQEVGEKQDGQTPRKVSLVGPRGRCRCESELSHPRGKDAG